MRRTQEICARKCFQERTDVIANLSIADSSLLQDVPREDVKIELGRNRELVWPGQDRVDQSRMIEHVIARIAVGEQINERDVIFLRTRQRTHDEIEIRCGKPRPTIRPDHRESIMSNRRATWQGTSRLNYE